MRDRATDIDLTGIELTDARTGRPVDAAGPPGVGVLSLIRHRF